MTRGNRYVMAFERTPDLYVPGYAAAGEPILVTEFGEIAGSVEIAVHGKIGACQKDNNAGWGYTVADDDAEFIRRYRDVVTVILTSPVVQGFCYTQLTDVEQEINGLLTYDRQPRVDLAIIREITAAAHRATIRSVE